MPIVFFSKMFQQYDTDGLVGLGRELGTEGWNRALRKGHPVNLDNVEHAPPLAAKRLAETDQPVLALTGETSLRYPTRHTRNLYCGRWRPLTCVFSNSATSCLARRRGSTGRKWITFAVRWMASRGSLLSREGGLPHA